MENLQEMTLVGYYHFNSKDKQNSYYVIQCLVNEEDTTKSSNKGSMINIFVDVPTYQKIVTDYSIGQLVKVQVSANYETGKIRYKVVI